MQSDRSSGDAELRREFYETWNELKEIFVYHVLEAKEKKKHLSTSQRQAIIMLAGKKMEINGA